MLEESPKNGSNPRSNPRPATIGVSRLKVCLFLHEHDPRTPYLDCVALSNGSHCSKARAYANRPRGGNVATA